MLWADPTDPSVFAAVTGQDYTDVIVRDDDLDQALAVSSEILTLATAHLIHPAGEQTEEFTARALRRFSPVYGPVTSVESVVRVADDGAETPVPHRKIGNAVHFPDQGQASYSVPLWRTNGACGPGESVYRVTYRFGSTLTAGARQAVLLYAHELYRWLTGDDECDLPEKVTSITREGIGIQLLTPQDFLDRGRTGVGRVDEWLAQANPRRALRPSAVYTPDSPPGVGIDLRRL
jgi:hypothetical protein